MAKFTMELPAEIMRDIKKLESNSEKIFGGMTKAGADVALEAVRANVPASWRSSEIMGCIGLTKTYKTPSDDGINTKVIISGYFNNKEGRRTPAPLVANVFEYGKTGFNKQPFFRRSFKKGPIEAAMLQAQKELSGGILEDE